MVVTFRHKAITARLSRYKLVNTVKTQNFYRQLILPFLFVVLLVISDVKFSGPKSPRGLKDLASASTSRNWPRPRSSGLSLKVLASFNITAVIQCYMLNTEYLWPYIFTNLPRSQNLRNKWHAKISGFTVYIRVWHFEVQEQQNICFTVTTYICIEFTNT